MIFFRSLEFLFGRRDGVSTSPQVQTSEIDDILDEIDGVLESNAEEFVRGFVQKGGQ